MIKSEFCLSPKMEKDSVIEKLTIKRKTQINAYRKFYCVTACNFAVTDSMLHGPFALL